MYVNDDVVASPGCAFDRTLTQCIPTPTGRLDANRFVTQVEQCKTIGQGLNVCILLPTSQYSFRS